MCYEVRNSLSGIGAKTQQKHGPFPPAETEKETKFIDLTERGKSDDIAPGSIIQVSAVFSILNPKPERATVRDHDKTTEEGVVETKYMLAARRRQRPNAAVLIGARK